MTRTTQIDLAEEFAPLVMGGVCWMSSVDNGLVEVCRTDVGMRGYRSHVPSGRMAIGDRDKVSLDDGPLRSVELKSQSAPSAEAAKPAN